MKKKIFSFCTGLLIFGSLHAQTWNGSATTDWNTAANWTGGVPTAAGNVFIPAGMPRYPMLAANVTINSINMVAGSELDVNGFTLTLNGLSTYMYFTGATLNNSNVGTSIILNINTGTGGYSTYFNGNTVNSNIVFNLTGVNEFYEGAGTSNVFNGNASFNASTSLPIYISNSSASQFNGNLTINRTGSAGTTSAFAAGGTIAGNFTLNNAIGGAVNLGTAAIKTDIGGTVNININNPVNSGLNIYRLINQTTGGTINIQNTTGFNIQNDTLKVTSFSVTGYKTGAYSYLLNNSITGNVTIADDATYTGGWVTYIHNNVITGTSSFTNNGTNILYEAEAANTSNTYNGNTSFTATNSGDLYVSHGSFSTFNGNLTVNRTAAGTTQLFNKGAVITGNFSYTNNTSGISALGSIADATSIAGTINIAASYVTNNFFSIYRLINQTSGGTINIQNTTGFNIQKDTLKVTSMSVTGYIGAGYGYFLNNDITGDLTIADDVTYGGGYATYLRNNVITGTSSFTNNGTNILYEADGPGTANIFNGNTIFTATNSGGLYISHGSTSNYNGNLTVNRTAAGTTLLFNTGAVITGNFSYTNNTSGISALGSIADATSIAGTINIAASYVTNSVFSIYRLINQTTGGTINIQNTTGFDIQQDTLKVSSISVTGYKGNAYGLFYNNSITGNLTIADDASYGGGYVTYISNNVITGNSSFTINGSNSFYDADGSGTANKYIGNLSYTKAGSGAMIVGSVDTVSVTQNLTLNSAAGITLNKIRFNGATDGIVEQLGTQAIIISEPIMEKTGMGKITLNDPVTVSATLAFNGGNIISSAANYLIFLNNTTHSGSSATSHVIGPVVKEGDDVFTFPLGTATSLNTIAMTAPSGATSSFKAEYKNQNPGSDGYNANSKAGTLTNVSHAGYWNVDRLIGATDVNLALGFGTNPYEQYPILGTLKVAEWNGAQWDDKGNGGTTGTAAAGTISNSTALTYNGQFALANVSQTYFYVFGTPGPGPAGTPVKLGGTGGHPPYNSKQLPAGSYSADSIYLIPNGTSASFTLKDFYNVNKDDTTVIVAAAPTVYISANGNGTVNFTGWRHFVYLQNAGNEIIGAIRDNDLTLGNTTMRAYFSTANVATASNGNKYLKRSFKITSQFAPSGTKRVRLYISKTEFNNLVAADPASFPGGINSLTIIKYTGPQEDSLFDPIPGGNSIIIPNSDITIADLGTMYSLDIDVTGFSGFYISGNNANLNICTGSTIAIPSNISGGTYQWQVDDGSGYINVTNTGIYSGVTTKTLSLTNIPGSMYGYTIRCMVNGGTPSQVYTIKFKASWLGAASTVWENPANWSCGQLPDANTDVVLIAGKPNYPALNSNTSVRSMDLRTGAALNVAPGFNLTIVR